MGISARRNLLKSMCANSPWTYAVFWKLIHQDSMLLTWEDGYCDYTKSDLSLKAKSDREEAQSICYGQQSSKIPMEFSLGFSIGYLSSLQYALGEGVIGRIALAGEESWIFPDDKFPDEWLQQVTAGIKTVLLVPVLPYGVLQLGSIDKVAENHLRVTEIRERFNTFHPNKGPMPSASSDSIICTPHARGTFNHDGHYISSYWKEQYSRSESEKFDSAKITHEELSSCGNLPFMVPDVCPVSLQGPSDVTGLPWECFILDTCVESVKESDLEFPCVNNDLQEALVGELFSLACGEEETMCSLFCDDANIEHSALGEIVDSYLSKGTPEERGTDKDSVFTDLRFLEASFDFPVGSELHEALGAAIQICSGEIPWEAYEIEEYDHVLQSYLGNDMDFINNYHLSSIEELGCVDDNINHPKAILPGAFEILDDDQFYDSPGTKPAIASPVTPIASSLSSIPKSDVKSGGPMEDTTFPQPDPASFFNEIDISHDSTDSDPTNGSALTTLVEEIRPKKRSLVKSGKGDKQPSNKKRKVTENAGHKPRPRDRQLIQDRLKELRELIPNGITCSIDGLLDKAIKHMMFLSSVTEQAEKLTQTVKQEVASEKKSAELQNTNHLASWAVEMNKDLELSPIVVKDLKRPGYMLIEMLCNEHDLFFEIAKVICHLRLTILKGIMETHSDNTWAQFIIEAPRGFSRMEIFVPLMQLLQLHRKRVHAAT